jgi:hypothetical protein
MAFHDRDFDAYVVLGSPDRPDPWTWPSWPVIAGAVTPLVAAARGKAAVRTTQFERDGRTPVRFGRIGWNGAGHEKWVHGSPTNVGPSAGWQFLSAELWAPSWSQCGRDGRAPDVFLGIRNERMLFARDGGLQFNPTLVLAIAADLGSDVQERALQAIRTLSGHLAAVLTVRQRRPWGKALSGGEAFTDAIQDLPHVGLFRIGDHHRRPVDTTTFADPSWTHLREAGG